MAIWNISKWFKKKDKKWETTMDKTPRTTRRVKVTQRKGVVIYEKIKADPRPPLAKGKAKAKKPRSKK